MNDSILVIGASERSRRKILSLLCNITNISFSGMENCDDIANHLTTHHVSAIMLEIHPEIVQDMERIYIINPHISMALYGENVTHNQTRSGFQHGAVDVLDIRNITVDEICKTVEHMLDPYITGTKDLTMSQMNRCDIIINRGQHFEQQLMKGLPPAYYMNGNRAVLLRTNVLCRNSQCVHTHRVILAWIDIFGITNTFCFTKQNGQLRLGAIVEQDYVNPASFRYTLTAKLEDFFQILKHIDCIAAAAYISSDFLSEGAFQYLNELVSSVYCMDTSVLLSDDKRRNSSVPSLTVTALYSAIAVHDISTAEAELDKIINIYRKAMPNTDLVRRELLQILWNCMAIIGTRKTIDAIPPTISIESIDGFRQLFKEFILPAAEQKTEENALSPLAGILQRIESNPGLTINIDQVSQELNYSRSHFCRLFRKETGMSFNEYLTKKRIDKACDLLTKTHMSCSEIANLVGFNNVYYFKQIFLKETGIDAEKWREKNGLLS